MRAITQTEYGTADVLRVAEIERPDAEAARDIFAKYITDDLPIHPDDLALHAVSLIGPRNQVAKLVKHLELLP
jgi:hypothetical protein